MRISESTRKHHIDWHNKGLKATSRSLLLSLWCSPARLQSPPCSVALSNSFFLTCFSWLVFFCLLVFVSCCFLIAWLFGACLQVRHCVRCEFMHARGRGAAHSVSRRRRQSLLLLWLVVLIRAPWSPANGLRGSRWSQRSMIFFHRLSVSCITLRT